MSEKYDARRVAKWRALRAINWSWRDIADDDGEVHESTIRRTLGRDHKTAQRRWDITNAEVRALYTEGMAIKAIARHLGCDPKTVMRRLCEDGLHPWPAWMPPTARASGNGQVARAD